MALISPTNTFAIVLLAASGLISLPVGAYIFRNRTKTIGARWLVLIFAGQAVWSLAYALQLSLSAVRWWLILDRFVVTGASLVILGWFLFVLTYTGYDQYLSSLHIASILSPGVIGFSTAWTNHYHGLFWQLDPRPQVLIESGIRYLQFESGTLYTPWLAYLFCIVIAVLIMLGATYVHSRSLHRAQVGVVLVAILLPLLGNIVFSLVDAGTLPVDITPILFTATNILVVIGLTQYRMLDSVPVSQHVLLEQLSEGVVVTDEDGEILHANQAARDIFGETLIGTPLSSHLPTSGENDGENILTGSSSVTDSELSMRIDGQEHHFDVTRTPYTDHRGTQQGAIHVFQDVTERQERASELARQNARLDKFASVLSHDLRNPLNVATGRIELARDDPDSEHLEAASGALDRMETLIEDVLEVARQGQSIDETGPVTFSNVADQCWDVVAAREATLTVESDLTFQADADRLRQLMENLFRNAIDHGGDDVTIRVGALSDQAGFYIADDGPGIPESEREAVFDWGHSDAAEGSGFGLAIVKEIAEAHGWDISVTESPSGGARFEIAGVTTEE